MSASLINFYLFQAPPATAKSEIMSAVKGSDEELDRLRKVLVEAIDEEKTRSERQSEFFISPYLVRSDLWAHCNNGLFMASVFMASLFA